MFIHHRNWSFPGQAKIPFIQNMNLKSDVFFLPRRTIKGVVGRQQVTA
jgi:hypothetical protein